MFSMDIMGLGECTRIKNCAQELRQEKKKNTKPRTKSKLNQTYRYFMQRKTAITILLTKLVIKI